MIPAVLFCVLFVTLPAHGALKELFIRTVPKIVAMGGVQKYFKPKATYFAPAKSILKFPVLTSVISVASAQKLAGEAHHIFFSDNPEKSIYDGDGSYITYEKTEVTFDPDRDQHAYPELYKVTDECKKILKCTKRPKIVIVSDFEYGYPWVVDVGALKTENVIRVRVYEIVSKKFGSDELVAHIVRNVLRSEEFAQYYAQRDEPGKSMTRFIESTIDKKVVAKMQSADPLISLIEITERPCGNDLMKALACNDFECVNERRSVPCPETRIKALKVIRNNMESASKKL